MHFYDWQRNALTWPRTNTGYCLHPRSYADVLLSDGMQVVTPQNTAAPLCRTCALYLTQRLSNTNFSFPLTNKIQNLLLPDLRKKKFCYEKFLVNLPVLCLQALHMKYIGKSLKIVNRGEKSGSFEEPYTFHF